MREVQVLQLEVVLASLPQLGLVLAFVLPALLPRRRRPPQERRWRPLG